MLGLGHMPITGRRLVTLLIAVILLVIPAIAADDVRDSVLKWHPGKRVQVTLKNDDRMIGRLGDLQTDGFVLRAEDKAQTPRTLRFDEVRSIHSKMTTGKKWAIAGLIYLGATVAGAALISDRR